MLQGYESLSGWYYERHGDDACTLMSRRQLTCVLSTPTQVNYGKKEEVHVHAIKALFKELELEKVFLDYEAASHSALTSTIEEQTLLPKEVFTSLLSKIYKRQK